MKAIRAIIFDLYGTLLRIVPSRTQARNEGIAQQAGCYLFTSTPSGSFDNFIAILAVWD